MAALSGLFHGINYMATDVDVQFFSHLNGLVLSNNWGDLIRLLDTCLVNGLPLTAITSATIDAQGDITLNLYADHKCLLFQIIELTGFAPNELNGKYRIKGIPSDNKLILKSTHTGKSITTTGIAKLASLGYEIIFRDPNDVKRVYRAKNPRTEHPFIRIDETISDGTNSYPSNYAKYATVGLLEHMTHIDDYEDPTKLQLPLDPEDLTKNWRISGTGSGVIRGWGRWYTSTYGGLVEGYQDVMPPGQGNRAFSLVGDKDTFYLHNSTITYPNYKDLKGCGLFKDGLDNSVVPNWFLMAYFTYTSAADYKSDRYASPLAWAETSAPFMVPGYDTANKITASRTAQPLVPDYHSGGSNLNRFTASNVPALEVPFYDDSKYLRGSLRHVYYAGKKASTNNFTTPILADSSMYIWDAVSSSYNGGFYFYLGELE